MANEGNLKPFTSEQSHEKAVENGRKGGIASGIAKRQHATWKEILEMLGEKKAKSKKIRELMTELKIPDDEQTSDVAKMFNLDLRSQSGDPKALETEAKIRGQFAPIQNVNENHNIEYKPLIDLTKRKKNGEK